MSAWDTTRQGLIFWSTNSAGDNFGKNSKTKQSGQKRPKTSAFFFVPNGNKKMPYFFDVCYWFSFHFFDVKNFSMALFYFHLEMKKMPHANLL
jgi:hypothetical protein